MSYSDDVAADRRRLILMALASAAAYTAPTLLVGAFLESMQRGVAADTLEGDLQWLLEQGLVGRHEHNAWTITQRGLDIVADRARHPGVRRPRPGETVT